MEITIDQLLEWICPSCGSRTRDHPAISRTDNKTEVCSGCGVLEAFKNYVAATARQEDQPVNGIRVHRREAILEVFVQDFEARYDDAVKPIGESFRSSGDICRWLKSHRYARQENFWVLLLNNKHRLLRRIRVTRGIANKSLVHPREVFREAIRENACAVVLAHNHPSGDPEPSLEDIRITNRLVDAGKIIGIQVLDHIILGSERHYSFADDGMLGS